MALFLVQPTVQCKHVELSDNEELIVYLFNNGNACVTPNIVVQYHEWSRPFLFSILPVSHILANEKARIPSGSKYNVIKKKTRSKKTCCFYTTSWLLLTWFDMRNQHRPPACSSGGQSLSVGVEITGPPHSQPPLPLGLFSVLPLSPPLG